MMATSTVRPDSERSMAAISALASINVTFSTSAQLTLASSMAEADSSIPITDLTWGERRRAKVPTPQ